jgi:multimeric flavodoxin WrbA
LRRILAIIGSPRKGETFNAVKRFEEELKKIEDVQIEYIMLKEYGFIDCTGCHNCIKLGQEFCQERDKISEIQNKMLQCDGVILATPVYNQYVTALMKKFLDYYTFLWHRPAMFGVKYFGISSGGGMFGPVFKLLKMNVENWGGQWVGSLGVPHYDALTDKFKEKSQKEVKEKAVIFLKSLEYKDLPKPSLSSLLWFNMWKMNAEAAKEEIVKDYKHWTETNWFNQSYYYDTDISFFKKAAAKFITALMRIFMRKVYKGY